MVWNHVFMAYETYRASSCDLVLFWMALPCTILSITRHVHREQRCNFTEPLLAKGTMAYLFMASFWLEPAQMTALMMSKAIIVAVWLSEAMDYERIHPWLHVIVAADAHYYIDCIR